MSNQIFIYRIDSTDTIVSVSDNWSAFADANAWDSPIRPENVVGHKIWDFIQDRETRHLYRELFRRVREGMISRAIPFRCDSPSERRHLELLIEALPGNQIGITSKILRTEPRSPLRLLETGAKRTQDFVTVCSMCKKLKVAPGQWAEIEEGLTFLRLFEAEKLPQLTHGLCLSCYNVAINKLNHSEALHKLPIPIRK